MESYKIYEAEGGYEILVKVYDRFKVKNVQKELIEKDYVIIKTIMSGFDGNEALIEAEKLIVR